jgi:hypothetical protein
MLSLAASVPAQAQVPDEVVLNIMRECAKIDDPTARLACYDNNIRTGGFDGRAPMVPGQGAAPQGSNAPITGASPNSPQGFGREDVRTPQRFETPQGEVEEITARVASVRQRQPGTYLVTLEGGAEWVFSESVGRSFRPPRRGDSVRIERASLGSFLMIIDGQQGVRVRRLQ